MGVGRPGGLKIERDESLKESHKNALWSHLLPTGFSVKTELKFMHRKGF